MNNATSNAEHISVSAPTPVVSVAPVVLPAPGRAVDLALRVSAPVSAPVTGRPLPVILLSQGQGRSNSAGSGRLQVTR